VGELSLHTGEVVGSIPTAPTSEHHRKYCFYPSHDKRHLKRQCRTMQEPAHSFRGKSGEFDLAPFTVKFRPYKVADPSSSESACWLQLRQRLRYRDWRLGNRPLAPLSLLKSSTGKGAFSQVAGTQKDSVLEPTSPYWHRSLEGDRYSARLIAGSLTLMTAPSSSLCP
jgi:hypothetical protein